VAGGCAIVDADGRCEDASASSTAAWVDLETGSMEALPSLLVARHGAHAQLGVDGVAYLAGGVGSDGQGVRAVERLEPGGSWELIHELEGEDAVAGLAVLDGELVLVSDLAGAIHWWSPSGEGTLEPTSRAPPLPVSNASRPLTVLPGERVLVDAWLFAPGSASVDPATERVELSASGVVGAASAQLLDGSVMLVGGRDPSSDLLSTPVLHRLRPRFDGADEWTPDLAGPQTDAFVTDHPGRATVVVGGLRLDGTGSEARPLPEVHAHVRGFRSRSARLELSYDVDPDTRAHLVLGQGTRTLVSLGLGDELSLVRRDESGTTVQPSCGLASEGAAAPAGTPLVLVLDGEGRELRLSGPDGEIGRCELGPWPAAEGAFLGFGVSGPGSARFYGLRLSRL
jgi:hypothetical protein